MQLSVLVKPPRLGVPQALAALLWPLCPPAALMIGAGCLIRSWRVHLSAPTARSMHRPAAGRAHRSTTWTTEGTDSSPATWASAAARPAVTAVPLS
jgi:hypothetical protein